MSKVFLHHLTPLIALPNFQELWLEILDYFERFMTAGSDMLYEAVLESLKNMLLVMHSVCVFHNTDGVTHSMLWDVTWQRISGFLPNLKDELFKHEAARSSVSISGGSGTGTGHVGPGATHAGPIVPPTLAGEQQHVLEGGQINNSSAVSESINPRVVLHPVPFSTVPVLSSSPPDTFVPHPLPATVSYPVSSTVEVHRTPVHRAAPNNLLMSNTATSDFNALPLVLPRATTLPSPAELSSTGQEDAVTVLLSSPAKDLVTQQNQTVPPPLVAAPIASNIIELPGFPGVARTPHLPINALDAKQSEPGRESSIATAEIIPDLEAGNVPLSHRLAGSQYPSLQHVPIGIAQSFAPIFVQPNPLPAETSDIYSDYINDPYNLTLQIDNGNAGNVPSVASASIEDGKSSPTPVAETGLTTMTTTTTTTSSSAQLANVFQSAQYFSFPVSGRIPPGSEMLFGEP
uniref:GBF1-like tetratricopeptide repeats domain-containing protein n=1 Tax=Anopheles maculatus TaxID=74869 RepID=A0A182STE4_9DIPT